MNRTLGEAERPLAMSDPRPTWQLVLVACETLSTRAPTFRRAEIIEFVQRLDGSRGAGSIGPIIQGMTANAAQTAPRSPCGQPLVRVDHGRYRYAPTTPAVPHGGARRDPRSTEVRRRPRLLSASEAEKRAERLARGFDTFVEHYDRTVPFRRAGQYEHHRETIDLRRTYRLPSEALTDNRFVSSLYSTLRAWGIGKRASHLVPTEQFADALMRCTPQLDALAELSLETPSIDLHATASAVDDLVASIGVVTNRALVVASTKALHHLLPDLVPPMDRAWTGAFFGWSTSDPTDFRREVVTEAFVTLGTVAQRVKPSRLVGAGWRTSVGKLLDNALIGYCKVEGIGG